MPPSIPQLVNHLEFYSPMSPSKGLCLYPHILCPRADYQTPQGTKETKPQWGYYLEHTREHPNLQYEQRPSSVDPQIPTLLVSSHRPNTLNH